MKKIIYIAFLLFVNIVNAQTWSYVGTPRFSNGNTVGGIDVQFLNNGTPVAGYAQSNYNAPYIGGAAVKYYNGTDWVNLGTNPLVTQNPSEVKIAVHGNTVFAGVHMGTYIKIFKYANDWIEIGEILNVYGGSYREFAFKVDGNGTPYVVFTYTTPNLTKPACKKYNGTEWVNVGANDGMIASHNTDAADIAFDENNVPYVAISREDNSRKVDLYKYNSSDDSWTKLNTNVLSLQDVYRVHLEAVSASEIYIGSTGKYTMSSDHRPSIVKYDGTNFNWIDSTNMTNRTIDVETSYDIHYHNGKFYHAYMTGTPGSTPLNLILESYNENNNTWTEVVSDLTATNQQFMGGDINIGFSNNTPVLAINEQFDYNYKATVIGSGTVTGSQNVSVADVEDEEMITVFPNPCQNELIVSSNTAAKITVTDLSGKIIYKEAMSVTTKIETSEWNNGIYLLSVETKNGRIVTSKVIKY